METNNKLDKTLTLKQQLFQFIVGVVSLYIAVDIVKSVQINDYFIFIVAVLIIQIIQWAIRPFFGLLTRIFGMLGILFISFFGNAIIIWIALQTLPDVNSSSFWSSFLIAWIYALLTTIVNWIFVSQSDDVFIAQVMRQSRKNKPTVTDIPGILFVQLDGVSAPVLDWQIKAGNLPNISKLLREQNYSFRSWHTQIPSTTPASQAGILMGNNDDIPAFRWYEKESGKLVVANQLAGAHLIEKRLSNGKGLLCNGGVSIGNLFSGDAHKNIMVMSKLTGNRESLKRVRDYTSYFSTTFGFMRSLILSIGEMIKEIYQARKQVSQDMRPRIKRHGSYIFLRAITNVLLRDLQTNIVIQNMMDGVNSIYVDYLDYDEVAHHAGMARAESLASLSGLDRVVGILFRTRNFTPRPYEIVIVSDHGQSQGTTFKQLHNGKTLEDFVAEYIGTNLTLQSETVPVEEQSAARSLLSHQSKNSSTARAASKSFEKNSEKNSHSEKSQLVITGSGNLGNIWINTFEGRAKFEQIEKTYPNLINNLLQTEGIGMILVQSKKGPLCISRNGTLRLKNNKIKGKNPLSDYQPLDRESLLRLVTMKTAPDIAVISSYDKDTGEVYAFEELVGNHGGLGGWQTEAILLHPDHLKIPEKLLTEGQIFGAVTIHNIFKQWLKDVGQK